MGWFYVDSTVDIDGLGIEQATEQTGSFATLGTSKVYGTVQQAIADGASDGDIIVVSDVHAFTTAVADVAYVGGTTTALRVICAEAANCDVRSTTGSETTTGSDFDVEFTDLVRISGIDLTTEDIFSVAASGTIAIIDDSTIKLNVSSNIIQSGWAGGHLEFNSCVIDFNHNSNDFSITNGGSLFVDGGSVIYTTSLTSLGLIVGGFIGGGCAKISNCDLSTITGASSYLVKTVGGHRINDDVINIVIDGCKLGAALTGFHDETFQCRNQTLLVTKSSTSSAAAEYQYYFHTRGGVVEDETGIYRDQSTAFPDSSQKVALKCVSDSNATWAMPFDFEFPTTFAELSSASTDTLRIYFITAETVDDSKVWATATYADGTNKNVFNTVNSLATPANDPNNSFRTPGSLITDSVSTWTGDTTETLYYMDLVCSDVGIDSVPKITMYIAMAGTFYFDTTVDVVA